MIDPRILRRAGPALAMASALTGSIVAGAVLGAGLDHVFGSGHLLAGSGAVLGLLVGFLPLVRMARKSFPSSTDDSPPRPDA